ncbi:DNA translocase SpoIIIE [Bacillus sp. THAF10]|uniref:FtsK/SpoIIIE family DNA translocase n=1 Tax=Bacillus sp. THAF10 TaxID=2587848 RepID=UPI0012685F71|nr:DNA translocase FtsK [Bacillus sp. THAF10]QFT88927.1 DNA translocase SpoIIIE [Bacillus sp. THAF10]
MSKRKKRQRKSKNRDEWKRTVTFEVIGLLLLALSCIAIAKLGMVGHAFVLVFRFFSGEWYMLMLLGLLILSCYIIWKRDLPTFFSRQLVGIYVIVMSILLINHEALFRTLSRGGGFANPSVIGNTWDFFWQEVNGEISTPELGGGMIGAVLFALFHLLFDATGARWIAMIFIVIGILLVTGKSLNDTVIKIVLGIFHFLKTQWLAFIDDMRGWREDSTKKKKQKKEEDKKKGKDKVEKEEEVIVLGEHETNGEEVLAPPIISSFNDREESLPYEEKKNTKEVATSTNTTAEKGNTGDLVPSPMAFTEVENKEYVLPSLDLLNKPITNHQTTEHENIYQNARKLEKTFASFGVKAKVTKVHLGPAVTKYEVYPDVGVKVSKIVNLSDDLALALAAKDIRIEAPIPGKSAIGIEVPNNEVAMVSLREVLDNKLADKPDSKLLIGLGRDISGDSVVAELNKMPHLLVAGATGSGKSVCINGIITSILVRAKPHEVKMMMIDPKMVELNMYNGVPHLLAPVVTDPKKASQALKKVVNEMERRYELFSHTGTRNIEGYNDYIKRHNQDEEAKQPSLPYIVVIVDELADLMMVASSDVEDCITRLAQMARAAGIHLIIATQRPSVDVITGVIKANIPSRIAFSVSSQTDSRTILDMGGAEKLLGRGDMLFLPVGASKPIRVQGAFLSDEEVERVVDFVIEQQKAQYQEEMIPQDVTEEVAEVDDELYDDAVQLILEMQSASVSMLQRRFRIGYTRAARLIDAMEVRGVVGPYEGSKPRNVLISNKNEDVGS